MKNTDKNDPENKNQNKLRKDRNLELIRRMKKGENLASFDSEASWFPPRPIIKKDIHIMKKLYAPNENDSSDETCHLSTVETPKKDS